jgi:hypothetical protein
MTLLPAKNENLDSQQSNFGEICRCMAELP